jgi:hypothetical protein
VNGQESWEEEIEETLKLVRLLPDSGEWRRWPRPTFWHPTIQLVT